MIVQAVNSWSPPDYSLVVVTQCPLLLPMRSDEDAVAMPLGTRIALDDDALTSDVLLGAVTALISIGALHVERYGTVN
jgi:hypothetical protein